MENKFNSEMAAAWTRPTTEALDPRKAVRGSGEGFWSPEAKHARTSQHEANSLKKVTMESQESAWRYRFGEPEGMVRGQEVTLSHQVK